MDNKSQLNLIEGKIFNALLIFVIPIMLGSLIQQLYTMVDAIIVGQFVGKAGLAAIDSVHTIFKFPINFMNGLSTGATILISGYYGSKDRDSLHCSIRTALTVGFVLGVVFSVIGVVLTPTLMDIMAVPENIYGQTKLYTTIYFSGLWSMVIYNMTFGILRAFGDSKRPLYVLTFCSLLNIIGDILLVGVLDFGVVGAAVATVLSQIISVILVINMLAQTERTVGQIRIWHLHFCYEHMTAMLKVGTPLALQAILFPLANSIVQANVNIMGTDAIAAWAICEKLDMLIWLVADSMGPALTTYVAQNIGAKKIFRVKKGALIGVGMSSACVVVISTILFCGVPVIANWFVPTTESDIIVPLTVSYMRMMAPFFVFYAIGEAFSGVCCGMGDTVKPMITTFVTICLLRVICIWFVLPIYNSMECIVWIYIASWIAVGCVFSLISSKKLYKLNDN